MSTPSITVMAVDDSRVALLGIKRMLAGTEFELAAQARSAAEAVTTYRRTRPQLVLMDIVMPDGDGVEALAKLREIDPNARVIMVSSLGTKEKVVECTEKGAASFLMKPYGPDDLLRVLRSVAAGETS